MSLSHVEVSAAAVLGVVGHALSTEKQEVMGLLLGRWTHGGSAAEVSDLIPLSRTDRRADRVEVGAEQLVSASGVAEGRGLQVVGWYHSHPHITAAPSHVDTRTQGEYQMLDSGFFGLIVAVFQGLEGAKLDARTSPSLKLAAFQSIEVSSEAGAFASVATPVAQRLWRPKDLSISINGADASATAVRSLAALNDALFSEELGAREAAPASLHGDVHSDAVFTRALSLLSLDSLYPLVHVAAALTAEATAKREAARRRRDDLKAKLQDAKGSSEAAA